MALPALEDILKIRQPPRNNNNTAFTFVIENLAGAVIGQRKWKTTRRYSPLAKHMTVLDEGFMLLVLENQYELWMNSESTKVGRGIYTENGPNRKFCGWTKEGLRRFNKLIEEVRSNRNKNYSDEVEDMIVKKIAERNKALMRGSGKKGRKRRRHDAEHSEMLNEEEGDDSSVIPKDNLVLLATELAAV
jgi:hypothetical protein